MQATAEHTARPCDEPDAPHNPMATEGFEFVEYATADPAGLDRLFRQLGFQAVARHRSKAVTLYRQGDINFILNAEQDGFAARFADRHGPSVCAIAFRVADAGRAMARALDLGATPYHGPVGPMELQIPAIEGIGGSVLYLVDQAGGPSIYEVDFLPIADADPAPRGHGLTAIDHLTHNVERGQMDRWAGFYERLFNFREIRYFDIEGKLTGLKSRAMTSPCGQIRIPINESADDKSQIEEFLAEYNGEGIQHIALASDDIFATVEALAAAGIPLMDPPPASYYDGIDERLPGHGEAIERLARLGILIDGAPTEDGGRLLQIFTQTVIGPIFFEIIQRKGDEGFGEGNFRALFEAIERDQIARGVL